MKVLRILLFISAFVPVRLFADAKDTSTQQYFFEAKRHLENMLSGKEKSSYEDAIYQIENAWWEGGIDYLSYKKVLDYHTGNILILAKKYEDKKKLNQQADLLQTKEQKVEKYRKALTNYAIYKYMTTQSFWVKDSTLLRHAPYRYNTKDPMGTVDWTNTHITHLVNLGKGNCFALASLFEIFSERLNSDARLCVAPSHMYISHADEKGTFYNVELSSRSFPGTGTIETLTYTPNEAVRNNISVRELNLHQSLSMCLVYLAKGYQYKFGVKDDDFMLSCAESALQYDDHNLNAMLLKAEVLENRLVKCKATLPELQDRTDFKEYQLWITHIFDLGYREMPFEMKNLLVKGWTKDSLLQFAFGNNVPHRLTTPQMPQTRYASLSWGLFDEEIKTKALERFGNTVFDTKQKKIVGFLKDDILYNQYTFDPVVFAMNVDPMAHKFPGQSPYSAFGDNPITNTDIGGAYQYPAKLAAGYAKDYPMITKYLAQYVQRDIEKSTIVQQGIIKNTYGGYTRSELVNEVAHWGKNSPEISFVQDLAKSKGATGFTPDSKHIQIDADYAKSIDKILSDKNVSGDNKQAAIAKFYETLIDETTHTGDLKDGFNSADEAGGDATREIFHTKNVKMNNGQTTPIDHSPDDYRVDNSDLSGEKIMINRQTEEGRTEVLPTVPH